MHELSIAQNIIESLAERFSDSGSHISVINIDIGQLTCVEADSLRFCLESIARDPLFQDVEVRINTIPGSGICTKCGAVSPMEALYSICPGCGQPGLQIRQGQELRIASVEIEDNV